MSMTRSVLVNTAKDTRGKQGNPLAFLFCTEGLCNYTQNQMKAFVLNDEKRREKAKAVDKFSLSRYIERVKPT